jgi:hypothetical protein
VLKGYAQDYTAGEDGVFYSPGNAALPYAQFFYSTTGTTPIFTLDVTSIPKTPAYSPPRSCGPTDHYWPPAAANPCHVIGTTASGASVYLANTSPVDAPDWSCPPALTSIGTTVVILDAGQLCLDTTTILRILSSLRPTDAVGTHRRWSLANT